MVSKAVHSMQEIRFAQDEWRAWRTVCAELERSGINLNDDNRLAVALRLWGEFLVSLRMEQSDEIAFRAHSEAMTQFYGHEMELAES